MTLPPDPIQLQPTYAGALAAFEALPPIRVLFDNGAGGSAPGEPLPGFEQSLPSFPIPGTERAAPGTSRPGGDARRRSRPRRRGRRRASPGTPTPGR